MANECLKHEPFNCDEFFGSFDKQISLVIRLANVAVIFQRETKRDAVVEKKRNAPHVAILTLRPLNLMILSLLSVWGTVHNWKFIWGARRMSFVSAGVLRALILQAYFSAHHVDWAGVLEFSQHDVTMWQIMLFGPIPRAVITLVRCFNVVSERCKTLSPLCLSWHSLLYFLPVLFSLNGLSQKVTNECMFVILFDWQSLVGEMPQRRRIEGQFNPAPKSTTFAVAILFPSSSSRTLRCSRCEIEESAVTGLL